jgi:hypothetical protein
MELNGEIFFFLTDLFISMINKFKYIYSSDLKEEEEKKERIIMI